MSKLRLIRIEMFSNRKSLIYPIGEELTQDELQAFADAWYRFRTSPKISALITSFPLEIIDHRIKKKRGIRDVKA